MPEEGKAPSIALDFLGDLERTHTCGELRRRQRGTASRTDGVG